MLAGYPLPPFLPAPCVAQRSGAAAPALPPREAACASSARGGGLLLGPLGRAPRQAGAAALRIRVQGYKPLRVTARAGRPSDPYMDSPYYPERRSEASAGARRGRTREPPPSVGPQQDGPARRQGRGYKGSREQAMAPGYASRPSVDDGVLLGRSQLLNKATITRSSGINLGTVCQLWVDVDEWRVVSLDLRDNLLFGELNCVLLRSLRQVGDVVLVQDESAVERNHSVYGLYPLVGSEIMTESGEFLGRVREYQFDPEDGAVFNLVFDAFGIPLLPDSVVSCYTIATSEVVSVGPDRIIVRAGSEARVQQLTSSLLQRLELAEAPWEETMRYEYYSTNDLSEYEMYAPEPRRMRSDPYERERERTYAEQRQRRPLPPPQQRRYEDAYAPAPARRQESRAESAAAPQSPPDPGQAALYGPRRRRERAAASDAADSKEAVDKTSFDEWLEPEQREYERVGEMTGGPQQRAQRRRRPPPPM